ncbi:MAG: SDR family NAD(P)-dependent oxidoreductase, partial [Gemmatimonadaceae bacterium]|nr:SDR family NAD(P)-dependent oxidoreductase [Gemmatimonadaceae bacterium]
HMPAQHLEGKTAIVTGGAGGVGRWISKIFAEQGARVLVADTGADVEGRTGVDPSRVNAVVDEIKADGGEAVAMIGDVADMDHAEKLVGTAIEKWGHLDILVCAHGILRERMIFNMTEDEWDGLVRAHLKGCFAPTRYAAIHWRQTRAGGRIIYFTSDAGIHGSAGQPNYSAAHAGKLGLMRSNARALARYGVTCNAIAPLASTRMTDRGLAAQGSQREGAEAPSSSAAGTAMDPKNVVPIIVWLASDAGGVANGRIFGASGHRISLYREPEWERTLHSDTPLFDIDKLFAEWPHTLGMGGFPLTEMRGMARPPAPAPSTPPAGS